jgi:hypothetical protein
MKSSKIGCLILLLLTVAACSGGGSDSGSSPSPAPVVNNVLTITVNGSQCTNNSFPNKACVSVTVCTPGTATCQTIPDILVDTGSNGLRIFKSILSPNLSFPQVTVSSGSSSADVAECVQFADGSADWGPVQMANVILGNEPAVQVPIHVLDAGFRTVPASCGTPNQNPSTAGYNGILGVGLFVQDCGGFCANSASNGIYYACTGNTCSGTRVPLANQVQNPVALLPQDNNGVIISLPPVAAGGAISVTGSLVLGIGTQFNNAPSGVTKYPANQSGQFTTTFNGIAYTGSFIDTSSNGIFFPSPSAALIPECPSPLLEWFCPSAPQSLTAANTAASGSPIAVQFQIGNAVTLFNSGKNVFAELGGSFPGEFDWGLPFHFGRNVYVGIEGKTSTIGTGPYWAY